MINSKNLFYKLWVRKKKEETKKNNFYFFIDKN